MSGDFVTHHPNPLPSLPALKLNSYRTRKNTDKSIHSKAELFHQMILSNPVSQLPPLNVTEIVQYLSSDLFSGIGKKTAQLLVSNFGENTLNVIEHSPEELYQVPGLAEYRIAKITQAWSKSQSDPVRGAYALLLGMGYSFNLTQKICAHYGHRTLSVLKDDPYRLVDEVDGIGFKTADELALALGIPPNSPQRYEKGIIHVLRDAQTEGHCFLPSEVLRSRALSLLERPSNIPDPYLLNAVIHKAISDQTLAEGSASCTIYLRAVLRAEVSVAMRIKSLVNQSNHSLDEIEHWLTESENALYRELSRLSPEQKSAVFMAVRHPISIITGGPGRGKTFVLKVLTEWLNHCCAKFSLVAPTGKAANRMKDATGFPASTIHRLLGWQGYGQSFLHNERNPLAIDWLIVDEFSMVDIFLFNSLLKACSSSTQILLVGDSDQLPSVGAGMVLRDLLSSELVPTTRLQTIYRQRHESPIIYVASDVNSGSVPALHKFNRPKDWMDVGDCAMLETPTPDATALAILALASAIKAENVDLNQQVMVLAPQKQGPSGVYHLNQLLQPIFNPTVPDQQQVISGEVVYRVGDRVMQLLNRYDTTPAVMNGESGFVIGVDEKKSRVTVEFEGGAVVDYYPGSFEQIMHSFCITCHKSQGSEFQYVIMPLLTSHRRMLTRQLLYTTITRAMGTFITVGQPEALELAVATDKPARRYTQLKTQLLSPVSELSQTLNRLQLIRGGQKTTLATVTIASRLRERSIAANKGQMTSIGSLALRLYEDKYGRRPDKQPEQLDSFRFRTYHYELDAVGLLDQAIDLVIPKA